MMCRILILRRNRAKPCVVTRFLSFAKDGISEHQFGRIDPVKQALDEPYQQSPDPPPSAERHQG